MVGLVAGYIVSVTGPDKATLELLGFPGEVLLSMLRALVVPLILSSIVVGITSLGSARNMGHLSMLALTYYVLTTIVAAIFGILWVMLIRPGARRAVRADAVCLFVSHACTCDIYPGNYAEIPDNGTIPTAPRKTPLESILDIIRSLFPSNLFRAALDTDILGIITFAIGSRSSEAHSLRTCMLLTIYPPVLGVVLIRMGERGRPLINFFDSLNEAIMQIVGLGIRPFRTLTPMPHGSHQVLCSMQ